MDAIRLITDYSPRAVALVVDNDCYFNEELEVIGGRYNSRLACGGGWIFSTAKHLDAVKNLLSAYEIEYTLSELTDEEREILSAKRANKKSKRVSSTCSKQTTNELPNYILSDEEYKTWCTERGLNPKHYTVICRLSGGACVPISTDKPQTEFWHPDEGAGYEEHKQVTSTDESKREYFLSENLSDLQNTLNRLDGTCKFTNKYLWLEKSYRDYWYLDKSNICPDATNAEEFLDAYALTKYKRGEYCKLSASDKERLTTAYKLAYSKHEKRCLTWLKKYGTKNLSFRTYWADR